MLRSVKQASTERDACKSSTDSGDVEKDKKATSLSVVRLRTVLFTQISFYFTDNGLVCLTQALISLFNSFNSRSRKKKLLIILLMSLLPAYFILSKRVKPRITVPDHGYKIAIVPYSDSIDTVGNRRIFYLETSGRPYLTRRQCCTVESVAKNNPDRPIQVFMAADHLLLNSSWLKVLENYPNVQIVMFDIEDYFTGTPLDEWYHEEEWKETLYKVVHLSDYMRVLTLLKGGGMYMDLDYIVMKRLDEETLKNFVLVETAEMKLLSNSVIHFEKGHWFIDEMIKRLNKYYEPIDYMFHGPGLISNLMARLCNLKRGQLESNNCTDIRVLPHTYFCPISNVEWKILFRNVTVESIAMVNDSYGIHTWSGKTKQEPLDLRSNQLFAVQARQHCPHTVANTDSLSEEVEVIHK